MPSRDQELAEVERRLTALVRCVIGKAETDSEFADQLKEIFLSDSLRASLKEEKPGGRKKRPVFDPVAYLNEHDAARLRKELDKPLGELKEIARTHKILPARTLRDTERDELINKIVDYAERKAHQGGVFSEPQGRVKDERGTSAGADGSSASRSTEQGGPRRTEQPSAAPPLGAVAEKTDRAEPTPTDIQTNRRTGSDPQ